MAKARSVHVCSACGAVSPRWRGQCEGCGAWNTLEQREAPRAAPGRSARILGETGPVPLAGYSQEQLPPSPSGIPELDRVLGQGLLPGAAVLLGGEPGIGKSTLLLQLAGQVAASGRRAVYVSGEESLGQLAARAARLGLSSPDLLALSTTSAAGAVDILGVGDAPALVVVDSVQTMASSLADGVPGSPAQVRAVASELVEAVKKGPATLILVGHVTKEGLIAGPKILEHMVDTVLYLEGDRQHFYRILRVFKNRFGPTDELMVLEMQGDGLSPVPDPSTYFLGERDESASGSAVVLALEGKRPFAVEVQALASRSYLAVPRRTALGVDLNRLNLMLAVLEKRLGLALGQSDIYAKTGGGLKLTDPGLDLGLVAAVLSSFYDRPPPPRAVFWGEVDLSGRIRPVAGLDARLKQARRLGYEPIFHPPAEGRGIATLKDFQKALFGQA
ncbi:DNA repair protein RadA [Fundidesulfovibrio magnetotacticus]|uniref:DNA repair protein RadA n=1 Tax=Fundidesulfovibrio magnetotacticus TaxID=2730080 RepID=A0A6V8LZ51_9BACT|nr:DNA repair protein RadA [Fundidesulfovibrio magnetotacticus]GFK95508.1 DNA repair protein RadA [Fundidesulfovibrio magnetotacticus]